MKSPRPPRFLFIVSDEGFGHAVRQSCVINELVRQEAQIVFQCGRPAELVFKLLNPHVRLTRISHPMSLIKTLGTVDISKTALHLRDYERESRRWIDETVNSEAATWADVIATDIVEEAVPVGKMLSKPVVAIGHFTWAWVLAELGSEFSRVAEYLAHCLKDLASFLYTPFSKCPEAFPNAKPIGLIARKARSTTSVRQEMDLAPGQKAIVISSGGTGVWDGVSFEKLGSDLVAFSSDRSTGVRLVPHPERLNDYISAADLVISRGGYSTISEALAAGTRHLILLERSHPETLANARMLEAARRAVVCDFDAFWTRQNKVVNEALVAPLHTTKMRRTGTRQAAAALLETARTTAY